MSAKSTHQSEATGEVEGPGAPYGGKLGRTRLQVAHVRGRTGTLERTELVRALNARTDPQLASRALDGCLHTLADGRELAVPYVYHDPEARKFALVVPEVLRHHELEERASLLLELARDAEHAVPQYVRDCVTVIGARELRVYLGRSAFPSNRAPELAGDEQPTREALAGRERAIRARESTLTDLATRLIEREEALAAREERLAAGGPHPSGGWAEQVFERELHEVREAVETGDADANLAPTLWSIPAADDVVESLPEALAPEQEPEARLEAAAAGVGSVQPPPLHPRRRETPPPLHPQRGLRPSTESRSSLVPVDPMPQGSAPPPLPARRPSTEQASEPDGRSDSDMYAVAEPTHLQGPQPEVAPPPSFYDAGLRMTAVVSADQLWLFSRMEGEFFGGRDDAELQLWVQGVQAPGCPLLVLLLTSRNQDGTRYERRVVLAPHEADDRRVIRALDAAFEARVALYDGERYQKTSQVRSPERAPELRRLLRMLDALPQPTATTTYAAVERLRSDPPPFDWSSPGLLYRADPRGTYTCLEPSEADRGGLSSSPPAASAGDSVSTLGSASAGAEARHRCVAQKVDAPGADSMPPNSARAQLFDALDDPERRLEAALSLCSDVDASVLLKLYAAAQRMSGLEAAELFASLVRLGSAGEDLLHRGLKDAAPHIRQLSALALAERAAEPLDAGSESVTDAESGVVDAGTNRRVEALLALLHREPTDVWREVARALGSLGDLILKRMASALDDSTYQHRHVLTLAHMANHGSGQELENLQKRDGKEDEALVRKVLAVRDAVAREDEAVRCAHTLARHDDVKLLSQRFFLALKQSS